MESLRKGEGQELTLGELLRYIALHADDFSPFRTTYYFLFIRYEHNIIHLRMYMGPDKKHLSLSRRGLWGTELKAFCKSKKNCKYFTALIKGSTPIVDDVSKGCYRGLFGLEVPLLQCNWVMFIQVIEN